MKPSVHIHVALGVLLALASPLVGASTAGATKPCALRVSAALAGEWRIDTPAAELPALVDQLLAGEHFMKLFAAFVNTRFNNGEAMSAEEDAVYYAVRHVLKNNLPWSDIYLGHWGWSGPQGYPTIVDDPNGLGYFTAPAWARRYAGNDAEGLMLLAAYRVVHNLTGIVMVPSPFNADTNANAVGRLRQPCASCHLDSPLALDKIAKLFPTRSGFGTRMTFLPPASGPQTLLGDFTATSLREFIARLLETEDYRFATCRLVFDFVYGRPENACEAPVFDACVDALTATDDIRRAIAAVVTDPTFCAEP